MDELIKMLDSSLCYISHEYEENRIKILAEIVCKTAKCPYCGQESSRVHSRYKRNLQDLPICGKKTILVLKRKKFFCENIECDHRSFAEQGSFFGPKARKTNRLDREILHVSARQRSISASKYLREHVADVGKSAICSLIKKTGEKN